MVIDEICDTKNKKIDIITCLQKHCLVKHIIQSSIIKEI